MPVQPSVLPPSVQPSVLPPSVLVPTLRQCEARDSKAEQFAGRLLESRRDPTRQEICALFGLLPCAPASSNLAAVCSFRTGMISREGIPLLADACHEYPLTTEIMTSFVRSVMPGHRFTTVSFIAMFPPRCTVTLITSPQRAELWPFPVLKVARFG